MKKWTIALALAAVALSVPLLCTVAERIGMPAGGNGSIVLIEHLSQSRGQLINGTCPAPLLTGPGYLYDGYRRLMSETGLVVNGTLRAVVGVTERIVNDAGSGSAGQAYGIYDLPASAGGIAVESLSPDGTVTLDYNGTRIALSPGERWETITAGCVYSPDYSMTVVESDIIRNEGFLAKSDIS